MTLADEKELSVDHFVVLGLNGWTDEDLVGVYRVTAEYVLSCWTYTFQRAGDVAIRLVRSSSVFEPHFGFSSLDPKDLNGLQRRLAKAYTPSIRSWAKSRLAAAFGSMAPKLGRAHDVVECGLPERWMTRTFSGEKTEKTFSEKRPTASRKKRRRAGK